MRRFNLLFALVQLVLAAAACTPSPRPYAEEIGAWHAEKDQFMRLSPESPVPEAQRASFPPLPYFPSTRSTACRRR